MPSMPLVTLIGYRGTGKSTVARLLAERLGADWTDADAVLEERCGCSIATLVRDRGETAFRDTEEAILAELLAGFAGVLASGGGVVLREANRRRLREAGRPVVWLAAPVAVIRSRLASDPATGQRRPALGGGDVLAEVEEAVAARERLYRDCSDWSIDTSLRSPAEVAAEIAAWLATAAARDAGRGDS